MAVAAPRAKKNNSATETARVMRVFDMLREELDRRFPPIQITSSEPFIHFYDRTVDVLEIADRIAARTEDPA